MPSSQMCVQAGPQQQQPPAPAAQQKQQQLAGTKRPAAGLPGSSGSRGADGAAAAAAADAAMPKGFFDDKTADKKARGIKE
jgi:hypothetical protein